MRQRFARILLQNDFFVAHYFLALCIAHHVAALFDFFRCVHIVGNNAPLEHFQLIFIIIIYYNGIFPEGLCLHMNIGVEIDR